MTPVPFPHFTASRPAASRQSRLKMAFPALFIILIFWTSANGHFVHAGVREQLQEHLQRATDRSELVISGSSGWLFFRTELRAVTQETFWGPEAAKVSRATNPRYADPLPAILDFHHQLQQAGITLWVAPVPAKCAVYPEFCVTDNAADGQKESDPPDRIDSSHEAFYRVLHEQGVTVVDLTDDFLKAKTTAKSPLFCRTDTHWSGTGIELAAEAFGKRIRQEKWFRQPRAVKFERTATMVEITGDLARLANDQQPVHESVPLTRIQFRNQDALRPVADDPESPILLLGDSHTLVFHEGSLFTTGCGLADHLAAQTGSAPDVIGVRGSGANAARLNWKRRPKPFANKKLVIWCFSMREFTENTDGWRTIPFQN